MLGIAIGSTIAAIAGAMLHELTHAIVARGLGAEIREVNLWQLYVEFGLSDDEPLWKDRVIGLSPLVCGSTVGILWFALFGRPSTDPGIIAAIGWAVYSFWGSAEDLSPQAAQQAAQ